MICTEVCSRARNNVSQFLIKRSALSLDNVTASCLDFSTEVSTPYYWLWVSLWLSLVAVCGTHGQLQQAIQDAVTELQTRLHSAQQRVSNAKADTQRRMRAVLDSAGREKRDVVYARLEKQYGGDNTGPPPAAEPQSPDAKPSAAEQ